MIVGLKVRILPAYSMDTRSRSNHDEYTGLVGWVARVCRKSNDALIVDARGEEIVWVHTGRLDLEAPQ